MHDFSKANWSAIDDELLKQDWAREFESKNIEEMWTYFKNTLEDAVSKNIPLVKRRTKCKGPIWGSDAAACAIRRFGGVFDVAKQVVTTTKRPKRCQKMQCIRRARKKYERSLVKSSNTNPSRFYAYVNQKKNDRNKIESILDRQPSLLGCRKGHCF